MPSLDGEYFVAPFPSMPEFVANCEGYWNDKTQAHNKPIFRFMPPNKEYFYGRFETMLRYSFRLEDSNKLQCMTFPPQVLTLLSWGLQPDEFYKEFMKHYGDIFDPYSSKVAFLIFKKETDTNHKQ